MTKSIKPFLAVVLIFCSLNSHANTTRVDSCLKSKNCTFGISGGLVGNTKLNFWVMKSEWKRFSKADKADLKNRISKHLAGAKKNPELYASSKVFGAGVPAHAPAYPLIVKNVAQTNDWEILLCHRKNERGALIGSTESEDYFKNF